MTSRVLITNDQTSPRALIVHFSNDAATRLLKPGESVDAAIYQGMCINLIESEEDYSHGEQLHDAQIKPDPSPESLEHFVGGDTAQTSEKSAVDDVSGQVSPADVPLQFAPKEGE